MELLQLRYFCTAARLENFSKAAEIHTIPQSAVSKTIRNLEKELGCELFDRKGKRVYLNENGKIFLDKVNMALTAIDSAVDELHSGELKTIGIHVMSGIHFVSELINEFEKDHPGEKVIYYHGAALLGQEEDFTFFQFPIDEEIYDYRVLMEDEIMLAAAKTSKWAKKRMICIKDLIEENFISYDSDNQLRKFTEKLCMEEGFQPKVVFEAATFSSLRSMVEAGKGISAVPTQSWRLKETKHAILIPFEHHPRRKLVIAWKKGMTFTPEKKAFLDYACAWFSQYEKI